MSAPVVVIVNVPFREQSLLIAQHTININNRALLVKHGCARYIVVVKGPNAFFELVTHVRESDGPFITISIDVIFIEGAECLADD